MWKQLIFITSVINQATFGKLIGDHICMEKESYNEYVTKYITRNVTVRNYQWCLNVPPRCSFYTNKKIVESRLVEKPLVRFIEKCCSGFLEIDNECILECPECIQGRCQNKKCNCFAGFTGPSCNEDCMLSKWGPNCTLNCECLRGSCDSKTGICKCPAGWQGKSCDQKCDHGFYGVNCTEICACNENELCKFETGYCENVLVITPVTLVEEELTTNDILVTTTSTFQTTISESMDSQKPILINKNDDNILLENSGTNFSNFIVVEPFSTINSIVDQVSISSPGDKDILFSTSKTADANDESTTQVNMIESTLPLVVDDTLNVRNRVNPSIATESHERINLNSKNAGNEIKEIVNDSNSNNNNELFNGVRSCIVVACIVVFILVLVLLMVTKRVKRKSGLKTNNNNRDHVKLEKTVSGFSTAAIYTHSIFHTPLPEPPLFENPIYLTPLEQTINETTTFKTHVVCNMNVQKNIDYQKYMYDYPPPTGCNAATSCSSDPDVEILKSEPVYDEIPQRVAPALVSSVTNLSCNKNSNALYMNTCGKTRF